ncbi:MAG: S8 family peptidase [Gemmatimonadota bacterium]
MDQIRRILKCDKAEVTGKGVRIAILDTGIDFEHPDLRERIDLGDSASLVAGSDLRDRHGHGTHIAGIIAGSGEMSDGRYRGIAPDAELVVYKISTGSRRGLGADTAQAIVQALKSGVDIINYSAGQDGYPLPPPWKWRRKLSIRDEAFLDAVQSGILCIAAAGNAGPKPGTINLPSALRDVLCVGSLTPDLNLAVASSRGPVYFGNIDRVERADLTFGDRAESYFKPDVVAPGGDPSAPVEQLALTAEYVIASGPVSARPAHAPAVAPLDPLDDACPYGRISGTSQATAVITGLAALALQLGRERGLAWGPDTGALLRGLIRCSGSRLRVGDANDFGRGVVLWPKLGGLVVDCAADSELRENVLSGPQLKLLE